ncbi:MAG: Type 1 glutamine amidotransferase-like domain-containing protein [Actinomycetota bacterium]
MGNYAVVGSGEYLEPMVPVDRELLAVVGESPRVACLPTAAGREGERMIDDWMQRGVDHFTALGVEARGVRVWDRESAQATRWVDEIDDVDVVYLSGGHPGHLYDTLVGTPTWAAIERVIGRGGLLIGCSAGAMVQAERFLGGVRRRTGFGLWPGVVVIPHFDEIPSVALSAARRLAGSDLTVVGVNGDTALLRAGESYRVIGDEVTIWSRAGRSRHGPGPLAADQLP